jgi:hypothetical protein
MSININDPSKPQGSATDATVVSGPPPARFDVNAPPMEAAPKKRKTWLIILIILVALCLCACAGVVIASLISGGGEFNFDFDLEDMLNNLTGFLPLAGVV